MNKLFTTIIKALRGTPNDCVVLLPQRGNWDTLQRWGIKWGALLPNATPLKGLYECTLPPGWVLDTNRLSSYSYLLDNRGLKRAYVFMGRREAYIKVNHTRFVVRHVEFDGEGEYLERPHYLQAYLYDMGLQRIVRVGNPAKSAVVDGKLVLMKDGHVYRVQADGSTTLDSVTSNRITSALSEARVLTNKEFYDTYHNREVTNYPHLKAMEELAEYGCRDYLKHGLPQDDSVWEVEYDLPEVQV